MLYNHFSILLRWLAFTASIPIASADSVVAHHNADTRSCDSTCIHCVLYQIAYSSAISGVRHAVNAYESLEWCTGENREWCPEAINTTGSAIAAQAISSFSVDSTNCDDEYLISALSTVSRKAAVWGMRWMDQMISSTGWWKEVKPSTPCSYHEGNVRKLHWTMWHLQTHDERRKDDASLKETKSTDHSYISPIPNEDNKHDNRKALTAILPSIGSPAVLLGALGATGKCTDPVLCVAKPLQYLWHVFHTAKDVLPKGDWLRSMIDSEANGSTEDYPSWSTEEENGGTEPASQEPPTDWSPENVEEPAYSGRLPPSPNPAPVKEPIPNQLYRAERYDPVTQRLE